MPGQPGNKNAVRHGFRAASLPDGCAYIEHQVKALRRFVISELRGGAGSGGPLTTYQEALVQSAMRHETRAALAQRWLRLEGAALSINDRLALTKAITDASDNRDKCLQRLGLDREQTVIDALYAHNTLIHALPEDTATTTPPTEEPHQ